MQLKHTLPYFETYLQPLKARRHVEEKSYKNDITNILFCAEMNTSVLILISHFPEMMATAY